MRGITVITPTITRRHIMLMEAMASVAAQLLPVRQHLIGVDSGADVDAPLGPAFIRNQLLQAADTDWVAFLDDDDTMDANHLTTLAYAAREEPMADLIYSWCRFDGPMLPEQYFNNLYDREKLRQHGIFPITVLARRSALLDNGGFRHEDTYEDWSLWNRMADSGCQFECVPEITWTYRTGHAGRTTEAMAGLR